MIIVAMNACIFFQFCDRLAVDFQAVIELLCLNTEFGCVWSITIKSIGQRGHTELIDHSFDTVALLNPLVCDT